MIAVGRGGFGDVFGVDRSRSPHREPPRTWTVATYDGLELPPGTDIEMNLVPGLGEVFHMRYGSIHGVRSVLAIGGVPGSPLAAVSAVRAAEAPRDFAATVGAALGTYVPHVAARIDSLRFAPTRPIDVIQGPIRPLARHATATVEGRPVLAIGDAWILNDPLAAQGANLGSRTAFVLGAAIVAGGPFDEAFARHVAAAMWAQAEAPWALSNALLEPPPPHVLDVLARAGDDPDLAARVADGFGHPERMLELLAPARLPA